MSRFAWSLLPVVLFAGISGSAADPADSSTDAAAEQPPGWTDSTGHGDSVQALQVRTNRFGGVYAVGQPIPVAVEIRRREINDPAKRNAVPQLFPHLTLSQKVQGRRDSHKLQLPIENRIWIRGEQQFEYIFDLRKELKLLEPGVYRISVGHDNFIVTDIGDWTGTLRSPEYVIRIVESKAESEE